MSGGGTIGCNRFKQNAWKKEMCSNCYKTKDEHQERPRPSLPDLPLISPSQSILKGWDRDRKKKRKSVSFPMDECEVIGFGGEELSSDDEVDFEDPPSSRDESSEEPDGDDDRALNKLTKTNTDFNSVLNNLTGNKTAQPVVLGNQKKEPIQVTVQPFNNNLNNSRKLHLNKLLQENSPTLTIIPCEKKEDPLPPKEETRKVNITRGSIITKNHESVKNKLYIQNILNNKNEKRNSYNLIQDKVYITTNSKVSDDEKDENVDYMNKAKNCVVLNCNGVSLLGIDGKDSVLQSRELAGEPDGKADSDEAEIPITPPPRISFLHREAPEIKRVTTETFETKRISTVETLHEIRRTVEPIECQAPSSPETRLNELVEIRRVSISPDIKPKSPDSNEYRRPREVIEVAPRRISIERVEPTERRISDASENVRKVEPALRRLSDSTEHRRNIDIVGERRFSEVPEAWRINDFSRRQINSTEEIIKCTKRQAPKPPLNDSESEVESEVKVESDSECERTTVQIESDTTPVPLRAARPETLKISVSSEDTTSISSSISPEPDHSEVKRNSPKREPPPLPPTTPEPKRSPPEPMPRHNKTNYIDVEKKKTKMKETIKKLLRFGTKEEMEVEIQSPRIRPQIIHPIDLNKSAVQVLPSANMIKSSSPELSSPSTPTPPCTTPTGRPNKPPPPPRSESLNLMERLKSKPGTESNIYANLGEARSAITPVKPVRTGSMREVAGKLTPVIVRDNITSSTDDVCNTTDSHITAETIVTLPQPNQEHDSLYEAIGSANSAPECDMGQQTYYGSETESDTYSGAHHQDNGCGEHKARRGRLVIPYNSIEENYSTLAQLNLQAINHLLAKILERDKNGGSLCDFKLDMMSRKELCQSVFIQGERMIRLDNKQEDSTQIKRKVTLAITPSETTLLLSNSLPGVSRFTDTLSHDLIPSQPYTSIGEVTVLTNGEVSRLSDMETFPSDVVDSEEIMEQKLLVLLQVLQIISQISNRQCSLDQFILIQDNSKQLSVTYVHHQANNLDENWKCSIDKLCNTYKLPEPLKQRLSTCETDNEATSVVTSWLYGPPPTLQPESLQSWLTLQRGYALRSHLAKSDLVSTQHLVFLASNIDLNLLHQESKSFNQSNASFQKS